jgi:hypothetical protein
MHLPSPQNEKARQSFGQVSVLSAPEHLLSPHTAVVAQTGPPQSVEHSSTQRESQADEQQ